MTYGRIEICILLLLLLILCKEDNETNAHFIGRCFATINVSSILEFHCWNPKFNNQLVTYGLHNGPIRRPQH